MRGMMWKWTWFTLCPAAAPFNWTSIRPGQARAFFTVHGMDDESLERVRQGLHSAAGFLRRRIADRLRLKSTPALAFEVDRVFEQEAHIDELLREVGASQKKPD